MLNNVAWSLNHIKLHATSSNNVQDRVFKRCNMLCATMLDDWPLVMGCTPSRAVNELLGTNISSILPARRVSTLYFSSHELEGDKNFSQKGDLILHSGRRKNISQEKQKQESLTDFYNFYLFYSLLRYFMFPRRKVSSEQIFQRTAVFDCPCPFRVKHIIYLLMPWKDSICCTVQHWLTQSHRDWSPPNAKSHGTLLACWSNWFQCIDSSDNNRHRSWTMISIL